MITRAYELLQQIGLIIPLLLLLVMSAMMLVIWLVWRRSHRLGKILALVIILLGTTFVVAKSISPAGKYAVGGCRGPGFEAMGISDEYYLLSGGVYYDVVDGRPHRMGSYYRKNGQWILRMDRRDGALDEQKLRFSVLGFDTVLPPIEGEAYRPTNFNHRRLVPFTKPRWMPEWLE